MPDLKIDIPDSIHMSDEQHQSRFDSLREPVFFIVSNAGALIDRDGNPKQKYITDQRTQEVFELGHVDVDNGVIAVFPVASKK